MSHRGKLGMSHSSTVTASRKAATSLRLVVAVTRRKVIATLENGLWNSLEGFFHAVARTAVA